VTHQVSALHHIISYTIRRAISNWRWRNWARKDVWAYPSPITGIRDQRIRENGLLALKLANETCRHPNAL
jgi:hypothetical protein